MEGGNGDMGTTRRRGVLRNIGEEGGLDERWGGVMGDEEGG